MTALAAPQLPVWQLAVASFLPGTRRERALATWIGRLPLVLALVFLAFTSLRLSNTAFDDEGLYIVAGHDYLAALTGDAEVPDYGAFFSGTPVAYPVVAALLDSVGGLWLVRLASFLMMALSTCCLWGLAGHLWGPRAAHLTAWVMAFGAPVAFVGSFATFDAWTMAFLALATWLGVTRRSLVSGAAMGIALALATIFKYTGMAFVPIVLVIAVAAAGRPYARLLLAAFLAGGIPVALLMLYGESVLPGIEFTTSGREALSRASIARLSSWVLVDAGIILGLAVVGAILLARSWRPSLLAIGLLAGAALLPAAQMRLGEEVSFEKHLAYAILFAAPLAGYALSGISRRRFGALAAGIALVVAALTGLERSAAMYAMWPPVEEVLALIDREDARGIYLSTSARTLAYHTREAHPSVHWEEHYGLYSSGHDAIREAVDSGRYQMVILRSKYSGTAGDDEDTRFLADRLSASQEYELVRPPFPTSPYAPDDWLVYHRVASRGVTGAD